MRSNLIHLTRSWRFWFKSSTVFWGSAAQVHLHPWPDHPPGVRSYDQITFDYRARPPKPPYVDFRVLNDPRQVLNALLDLKDSLQMFHVTAALSRLKALEERPPKEILEEATSYGQGMLRSANGNDVVGVFVALAKLRFVNLELLNGLANKALKERFISQFSLRELASMVHSIAILLLAAERKAATRAGRSQGFDPRAMYGMAESDKLLSVILDELALNRRSDADIGDRLSSVISSLTLLGRHDSRLDTLMAEGLRSVRGMSSMTLESIANSVLTIGKTGEKQELLPDLCSEIQKPENLKTFEWGRLVSVTRSLSSIGFSDRGFWKAVLEEMCRPSRVAQYEPEDFELVLTVADSHKIGKRSIGTSLMNAILWDDRYETFEDYQLASIISVFGKYDLGDNKQIVEVVPRIIKAGTIADWPTRLISGLAVACLRFKAARHPVFDVMAKEMAKPDRLQNFDSMSTIRFLYSFVMLDWYHAQIFPLLMEECLRDMNVSVLNKEGIVKLSVLLGRTKRSTISISLDPFAKRLTDESLLGEYTEHDLTAIVYNLGRFRDIDADSLQSLLGEIGKEQRIQEFKPPQISAIVLGLSRLGLYDEATVENLCEQAIKIDDVTLLSRLDVAAMMTGLADLNHVSPDAVNGLMRHLVKGLKYRGVRLQNLEKILAALVKLDMTKADHCLDIVRELGRKKERLKHATADTVCNLLYVMGKEGLVENKLVHQIFRKIANAKRNRKFDEVDMMNIRQAVFNSGIFRTNLMDVVREREMKGRRREQGSEEDSGVPDRSVEEEEEEGEGEEKEKEKEVDYGMKILSLIL